MSILLLPAWRLDFLFCFFVFCFLLPRTLHCSVPPWLSGHRGFNGSLLTCFCREFWLVQAAVASRMPTISRYLIKAGTTQLLGVFHSPTAIYFSVFSFRSFSPRSFSSLEKVALCPNGFESFLAYQVSSIKLGSPSSGCSLGHK